MEFQVSRWFIGDRLSQEAGTDPGCFHAATETPKVMESQTAVGGRIPPLPLIPGFSTSPLQPSQLVPPVGTMQPGQMATWQLRTLMKHTHFFFFFFLSLHSSSPVSVPLSTTPALPPSHIWPGQHTNRCQGPHVTASMQKPCLFISCHDSIAISCLVVVFTCQAWRDVLRNSRPVPTFDCWGNGTFAKSEQRS